MAKLKLHVDDLRVESFAVAVEEGDEHGTVRGHAQSAPLVTCAGNPTCRISDCNDSRCIDSCLETCKITCGECLSVEVCT